MAWPAWAIAHLHSVFFSGAVNVPHGANLLSNTSGPLIGVLLAPVTWTFGPVAATNVALTLAPALSALGLFRRGPPSDQLEAGAIPAALVYGYSSAIVTSIAYGHVSVDRVGDPTVPLHLAARDRDPPGALGPTRRAPPGRAPRRAVLHIARDPGDVPRPRTRRPGGGRGGRLAPAAAAGRARAAQPGARRRRDRGCAGVPRLVRIGRAPSGVGGVVRAGADLRGAALGPARTGGVRRGGRPATALRWLPGPQRPAARLRRLGGRSGFGGCPDQWSPPAPDMVALPPRCRDLLAGVGGLSARRADVARASMAALERSVRAAGPQGDLPDQFVPLLTLFLAFLIAVGLDALHARTGGPLRGWRATGACWPRSPPRPWPRSPWCPSS